ncbi:hypothetical protein [uncultured Sphingomonas sp.]|uniref:hypothetical protein n=1 Tax=uncultured Sphingomonas sp. TaxID=158754 RepID=UPI0037479842
MRVASGRVAACLALTVLVSGCATVRSSPRGSGELASGVTYYLPKRDMKLTAERKLLKKEEVEKALAAKKGELETASTALQASKASVEALTKRAATAAIIASPEAGATVAEDLAIASADVELGTAKTTAVGAEIKILEAALLTINASTTGSCTFQYSAKLEVLPPTADTRLRLVADPFHSPLRDDDTKLSVTQDGLLTSANVVSADRTGDIIVEIASAVGGLGAGAPADPLAILGPPPSPRCDQMPVKFVYRFNPVDPVEQQAANDALAGADFPFRIDAPAMSEQYTFDDPSKDTILDRQRIVGKQPGNSYVLDEALRHHGIDGALFYRTALPQTVVLGQCQTTPTCAKQEASVPIDAAVVLLPQAGPLSYIPMRSSAFVKTVDDVVFDNGMLASWTSSRPSEVLEVVRLPVKILKALVSVPAEIIKLRIDLSDQEKGLAASQQAQIAANARLAAIQACMKSAGADQEKQMACFKTE